MEITSWGTGPAAPIRSPPPGSEGLLNNGQVWSTWIDYDGVADRMEARVKQGAGAVRPDEAFLAHDTDLGLGCLVVLF